MEVQPITIDREPLLEHFTQWQREQQSLQDQVAESLGALAAYQEQLERWDGDLAQERSELEQSRQSGEEHDGASDKDAHMEELIKQLAESRAQVVSLSNELKSKESQLQEAMNAPASGTMDVESAFRRLEELSLLIAEEKEHEPTEKNQWAEELDGLKKVLLERTKSSVPKPRPKETPAKSGRADPVLSSVVAQFDKLRQQQAKNRGNKR